MQSNHFNLRWNFPRLFVSLLNFRMIRCAAWNVFKDMRCTTCMARRYFVFTNYYKLVQVSKQIALFSFPLSFALGLLFFLFLHFHLLVKLDFSPTSDFPTEATIYSSYQAFLISSCNLILFSGWELLVSHVKLFFA